MPPRVVAPMTTNSAISFASRMSLAQTPSCPQSHRGGSGMNSRRCGARIEGHRPGNAAGLSNKEMPPCRILKIGLSQHAPKLDPTWSGPYSATLSSGRRQALRVPCRLPWPSVDNSIDVTLQQSVRRPASTGSMTVGLVRFVMTNARRYVTPWTYLQDSASRHPPAKCRMNG
jgi:hypothetical protein